MVFLVAFFLAAPKSLNQSLLEKHGGESGIRTHVTLSSKHAFQACAFSHSAISPAEHMGGTIASGGYRVTAASAGINTKLAHLILWTGEHERKSAKSEVLSYI